MATMYSLTPLKEILRSYNDLGTRGFNSDGIVKTLKSIVVALRATGFKPRVQGDYTATELDQSWRMEKLVDDLKFGLKKEEFISANHFAKIN